MKSLMTVMALLLFLITAVAIHYATFDRAKMLQSQQALTAATGLGEIAYGAAWTAPRSLHQQSEARNPAYPELDPILRSNFVYAH